MELSSYPSLLHLSRGTVILVSLSGTQYLQVKLNPGQAIYLPANEPHAYVSGELVECMAASDNVIRAGLTPKLRDTEVLCSSLTYSQGLPQVLEGDSIDTYVKSYSPPFDEFEVQAINVPKSTSAKLPVNQVKGGKGER